MLHGMAAGGVVLDGRGMWPGSGGMRRVPPALRRVVPLTAATARKAGGTRTVRPSGRKRAAAEPRRSAPPGRAKSQRR
ncbi:hypothetical protein GCM10010988_15260 [Cnuibacter physcomitrellae]|nr:hypothetical protein GCM10010988_15260 [Cnuibacter physcomitrellae]